MLPRNEAGSGRSKLRSKKQASASPSEILKFLAANETFERTLEKFPSVTREQLEGLLRQAATLLAEPPPVPQVQEAEITRVRVYSDGAARGNPGPAGAGAVLVSHEGQVVDRLGKFLGSQTNNYAEYMGLLLGLKRALQLGVKEVEVFADSELMIRQLGGRYQVKSASLRPLYDQALSLLNEFDRVKLVHVPREMNRAADEMSNKAIDQRL